MEYLLETKNLSKKFKNQTIVEGVNLSVPKNSIYGLLGPNGAGKSTILKMICGIYRPSDGAVYFKGEKWNRGNLKDVGVLIENPPLYENLTARENLKVRTTALGIPNSRIDEVLEIVNLTNTGKKVAGKFSLGMKQRLGIAMALLNKPKLIILDEPTNGLDPIGIEDFRNLIKSLPKKDITVILSSHILSEVEQVVDEVAIISDGVVGYEGKINENLEGLFRKIVLENRREN
ncbi:lantibiotic protection ABC transporter ATP-binding protein [Clostridium ihumii]|uniref:lantibiotic protection ABC transporter ATP-binding protein n=1 Tax=Clostridium ihumii TaxID=1470356 RepID=UPI00058EA37F|nr:lantibiotic protection ABC transporter ATP-binding protein [Clostridium ihumii]